MRNLETRNPGEESWYRSFLNLLNSSPNESGKQARNAAEEKNQMNQESRKRGKEIPDLQTARPGFQLRKTKLTPNLSCRPDSYLFPGFLVSKLTSL
jgi:hypothetical protein